MVMHLIVSIVIHFLSEPFWVLVVQFLQQMMVRPTLILDGD